MKPIQSSIAPGSLFEAAQKLFSFIHQHLERLKLIDWKIPMEMQLYDCPLRRRILAR
jgi:hypothetical protein